MYTRRPNRYRNCSLSAGGRAGGRAEGRGGNARPTRSVAPAMPFRHASKMVAAGDALTGRSDTMPVPAQHFVNGHPLALPFPDGMQTAVFGMGCFWGAERKFWQEDGVFTTAV